MSRTISQTLEQLNDRTMFELTRFDVPTGPVILLVLGYRVRQLHVFGINAGVHDDGQCVL